MADAEGIRGNSGNPFDDLSVRGRLDPELLSEAEALYMGGWRERQAGAARDFSDAPIDAVTADVNSTLDAVDPPPAAFAGFDPELLDRIDSKFRDYKSRRDAALEGQTDDPTADGAEKPAGPWNPQPSQQDHAQMLGRAVRMSDFAEPPEIIPLTNPAGQAHGQHVDLFGTAGPDGDIAYTHGGWGPNNFVDDTDYGVEIFPSATPRLTLGEAIQAGYLAATHSIVEGEVVENAPSVREIGPSATFIESPRTCLDHNAFYKRPEGPSPVDFTDRSAQDQTDAPQTPHNSQEGDN